jgi:superfamily II DNA or RNA helicase
MQLRPYQEAAISRTRAAFAAGARAVLLCAPTGAGKTVIASEMIRGAVAKGRRCLFLVHRRELIDQAVERLAAFGVEAGVILSGRRENRSLPVQVASVQTLMQRDSPPAEFVFIDECHHATADSYLTCLAPYQGSWITGLTATPARLDGAPLKGVFEKLVVAASPQELCDAGVLVAPVTYSHPEPPDTSKLRVRAGDFEQEKLGELVCQRKFVGDIVEHWLERSDGQRTVAFSVNIMHSLMIVDAFRSAGVEAEHLDGETPHGLRAAILARLRSGETRIVSNCGILGEGYDLPELCVMIGARPTASLCLWRQQIGRIMRSAPGKARAVVLDHAGNTHRHGLATDDVDWTLDGKATRKSNKLTRWCPKCYANVPIREPECPECGFVFKVDTQDPPDDPQKEYEVHAPGELTEYKPVDRRAWYRGKVQTASTLGYRLGWARNKYREEFKVWPRQVRDIENEIYRCPKHTVVMREYGPRCDFCLRG